MPEQSYGVRTIYFLFLGGAGLVLFARAVAYWLDWQARTVRILGVSLLLAGTLCVFGTFGPTVGLKALLTAALGAGLYLWQNVRFERADMQKEQEERERLLAQEDQESRPPQLRRR